VKLFSFKECYTFTKRGTENALF